jgi:hypothetical protein
VDKKPKDRFHLNHTALQLLTDANMQPFQVSVNRPTRTIGKGSSVIMVLRAGFQYPRWQKDWLCVSPVELGWSEVTKVYWRHK